MKTLSLSRNTSASLFAIFMVLLTSYSGYSQSSVLVTVDSLVAVSSYSEALSELEQIDEKSDLIYLKMAEIQSLRGEHSEALKNYQIVLKNNPDRILTSVAYAKLLSKTGEVERSDSIFSALAKDFPSNPGFQYQLGLLKERQQDSTAISYFSKTLRLDPVHQGALFKLAKSFISERRYSEAQLFCEQGLEVNPVNPSLLSLLAQAFYHQREFAQAIPPFQRLIALGHGSEFVHTSLAYSFYMEHEFEKAIEHYTAALLIESDNPETHHNLGKLYAAVDEYKKSELHLLQALLLKKQPVDTEFLSLALTYQLQKQYKKAMDAIKNALEENPKNERAWYERALIAEHLYEGLDQKLGFYESYVSKFEHSGNEGMVSLAKRRISDLKEQIHLSK